MLPKRPRGSFSDSSLKVQTGALALSHFAKPVTDHLITGDSRGKKRAQHSDESGETHWTPRGLRPLPLVFTTQPKVSALPQGPAVLPAQHGAAEPRALDLQDNLPHHVAGSKGGLTKSIQIP